MIDSKNIKINWLKDRISRIVYGEKTEQGIRPNISKRKLIKNNKLIIRSLPNKKIEDHIKKEKTIYFYGNGKTSNKETLVMIDIDVQKKNNIGSTDGAINFVNHLKKEFPNLYYEPSTNEKGIHAYFILEKLNISAKIVNKTLKGFENWLKKEAEKTKADIELVEIKGLCPEIIYKNKNISNIKYGTLAKVPRNLEQITLIKNQYLSINQIEKEYFIDIKNNKNEGSTSNKLFSKEDLEKIEAYKKIFNTLTDNCRLRARKHIVTDEDFAIGLLILLFINKNPNEDGSIPTERVKQLWISLFKYHNIKRNWNHHRWKTIRDFLSSKSLINWKDNKYNFGDKYNNIKGNACKWSLSHKFLLYVQFCVSKTKPDKEAPLMDTDNSLIIKIKENISYLKPILKYLREINYENMIMKIYSRMESLCSV
jgi:hypothetical protein